jgi:carbonic anhydrase
LRIDRPTVPLIFLTAVLITRISQAQWKTPWSYEGARGPDHWGDLDPDYAACKTGKEQSPIDIHNAERADLLPIRVEYRSEPLRYLINNGYTIRVNYHDAPGIGNFLVIGNAQYHLTQFHFHRPSEETVEGKAYPMEAHLMHQSNEGKVVGVVVFLKEGPANPAVQQIWDHMAMAKSAEEEIRGVQVNPADLMPRGLGYYQYEGSITAPPCTEGVTWIVLKTPITISSQQIAVFARLYPHDVRPVQPLNGRVVKESK